MNKWQMENAADKALFNVLFIENNPDMSDEFVQYDSPVRETSLFKGIPNTEDNRHKFLDLFRDMKKAGHFNGKRIKLMYRGPRNKSRGRSASQSFALQSEGTTFAVYLYITKQRYAN